MKLKTYIALQGLTPSEAARQNGVTQQLMHLWVEGLRIPRPQKMRDLYLWSHGAVTPNDFYDLPALPAAEDRCNGPSAACSEVAA